MSDPKAVDQPRITASGTLTQNGKFNDAATRYKLDERCPERVRVYEKIKSGIWVYNGVFDLIDSWTERDELRSVFRFKLAPVAGEEECMRPSLGFERKRIIPTAVKIEVWKRDGGRCQICDATDELHFDHVLPFSKGGTSITATNVQLLCARHNLLKRDHIQ